MKDTLSLFEKRSASYQQRVDETKALSKRLSLVRIVSFLAVIFLIIQFANNAQAKLVGIITALFIILFIFLLRWHNKVRSQLKYQSALRDINEEEINRLSLNLSSLPSGQEFYQAQHPYHEDLDIFGKHSLFQLIDRSSTEEGQTRLAQWLSESADEKTISKRQKAIQELSEKLDFRQSFHAIGRVNEEKQGDKEIFISWLNSSSRLKRKEILQVALAILPLLTIGTILGAYLDVLEMGWPLLVVVINMLILAMAFTPLDEISKQTENGYKSLGALKELILLVEQEDLNDDSLKELKERIHQKSKTAANTLSQLKFLLDTIHNRANLMYVVFDTLFILDVYWLLRIHRWKEANKLELQQWFDVMAEFDALNSLAGYAFANPQYSFPKLSDTPFTIEAKALGHPLIKPNQRVNNDFSFHGRGGICLITGSNMSGKSTFLRTLGVNMVLAQAGAPVCAQSMTFGLAQVFTSMRTTDELEENVSSFYAELKRLKKLLDQIDDNRPTLFMIDEVLKGTNSEDRHKGAIALIKQLNSTNAFGLVSTHDLVLGSLANELAGVKNYSFNSVIKGDEIIFDYTLTEGICKSFNATKLMQNMGIDIPEE